MRTNLIEFYSRRLESIQKDFLTVLQLGDAVLSIRIKKCNSGDALCGSSGTLTVVHRSGLARNHSQQRFETPKTQNLY